MTSKVVVSLMSMILLAACTLASPAAQSPEQYRAGALNWIQDQSLLREQIDWNVLRAEALAHSPAPQTIAETHASISLVLERLRAKGDKNALLMSARATGDVIEPGFNALAANGLVTDVMPGSPAERAGLRIGDVIMTIDGAPPGVPASGAPFIDLFQQRDLTQPQRWQLLLQRAGQAEPLVITVAAETFRYVGQPTGRLIERAGKIGYLALPWDWGSQLYATQVQRLLRDFEQQGACGWIIDLRRNLGGNLWTYIAAVGPLLGEGDLGGMPALLLHTALSGGATIYVSGAWSQDRTGQIYQQSLTPDQPVATDWAQLAGDNAPSMIAAQAWLAQQAACRS